MKIRFLALAGLLALAPAITWGGSVYKWVDENGVVHYGDKQPGGQKSEKMRVRTSTGSKPSSGSPPSASESNAPERSGAKDKQDDQEEKNNTEQRKSQADGKNEEACQRARENLEVIENNARIRITGEDGEQRYLTPEEIEEQKERAQEIIDQAC